MRPGDDAILRAVCDAADEWGWAWAASVAFEAGWPSRCGIGAVLARLERKGLVERKRLTDDPAVPWLWGLTDAGEWAAFPDRR